MITFANATEYREFAVMTPMKRAEFLRRQLGEVPKESLCINRTYVKGDRRVRLHISWKDWGYMILMDGCRIGDMELFPTLLAARKSWGHEVETLKANGYTLEKQ